MTYDKGDYDCVAVHLGGHYLGQRALVVHVFENWLFCLDTIVTGPWEWSQRAWCAFAGERAWVDL